MARTVHIDSARNLGSDLLVVAATITEADGTVRSVTASGWVSALTNYNGTGATATGPQSLLYCKQLVAGQFPPPQGAGTDLGITG